MLNVQQQATKTVQRLSVFDAFYFLSVTLFNYISII